MNALVVKEQSPPQARSVQQPKFSVFNGKYKVLEMLGCGHTSRVFLGEELGDPTKKVAIKIFKQEFLARNESSIKLIEKEIKDYEYNIITIVSFGS